MFEDIQALRVALVCKIIVHTVYCIINCVENIIIKRKQQMHPFIIAPAQTGTVARLIHEECSHNYGFIAITIYSL